MEIFLLHGKMQLLPDSQGIEMGLFVQKLNIIFGNSIESG